MHSFAISPLLLWWYTCMTPLYCIAQLNPTYMPIGLWSIDMQLTLNTCIYMKNIGFTYLSLTITVDSSLNTSPPRSVKLKIILFFSTEHISTWLSGFCSNIRCSTLLNLWFFLSLVLRKYWFLKESRIPLKPVLGGGGGGRANCCTFH